ncbi:replication protein A 70 kDa DNA-binding subunit A-like [Rutidosis leptorrhynchoides]|uniref:replication protein A 70 kDa DNA-binding subunit A-like n=1 Tax=Rutidosis leptorrhynchoides TaxID=125765 RepID=UPI003A99911C
MVNRRVLLHEISPIRKSWKICVKIIRFWSIHRDYNLPAVGRISMILMDENGNQIVGFLRKALISNFEQIFEEGSLVLISNFEVVDNTDSNNIVNHRYKLAFSRTTRMKVIDKIGDSLYGFRFSHFQDFLSLKTDLKLTFDLVGRMIYYHSDDDVYGGKERKKLYLDLQDLAGNRVSRLLFGGFADELSAYLGCHGDGVEGPCIVLVIRFAKVVFCGGIPYFTNCSLATNMLINPDLPEVSYFTGIYDENDNDSDSNSDACSDVLDF